MTKKNRTRKYFAPQNEDSDRICDHPGCQKCGEYRAPKDRDLKEYYWFCLEHVQEYNAQWNYFAGISDQPPEDQEEEPKTRKFRNFGAGVKYNYGYKFKDHFEFFDEYSPEFAHGGEDVYLNEVERNYLKVMELKPGEITVENIRSQYKKLVKKYHPDLHQGNKDSEEKFKQLTVAYRHLMTRFQKK